MNRQDILFFVYNGHSSLDMDIKIKGIPRRTMPARRGTAIEVPFRDGNLTFDEGVYSTFTIDIECVLLHNYNAFTLRRIKDWLSSPRGELFISDNNDVMYEATLFNKVDFTEIYEDTGSFLLTFECQPFAKYIGGSEPINYEDKAIDLYNFTMVESYPYFKLIGEGDLTLTVNGEAIEFKGVDGYIELDSELMECYKDNTLCNRKMRGYFPVLKKGVNKIEHNGSALVCIPNWRVL